LSGPIGFRPDPSEAPWTPLTLPHVDPAELANAAREGAPSDDDELAKDKAELLGRHKAEGSGKAWVPPADPPPKLDANARRPLGNTLVDILGFGETDPNKASINARLKEAREALAYDKAHDQRYQAEIAQQIRIYELQLTRRDLEMREANARKMHGGEAPDQEYWSVKRSENLDALVREFNNPHGIPEGDQWTREDIDKYQVSPDKYKQVRDRVFYVNPETSTVGPSGDQSRTLDQMARSAVEGAAAVMGENLSGMSAAEILARSHAAVEGSRQDAKVTAELEASPRYQAQITAGMAGELAHATQGLLNAVNGVQDIGVAILNLPARIIKGIKGDDDPDKWMIHSSDWSRGLIPGVVDTSHDTGKMIGGQGLFLLGTLGLGAWLQAGAKAGQVTTATKILQGTNVAVSAAAATADAIDAHKAAQQGKTGDAVIMAGSSLLNALLALLGLRGLKKPGVSGGDPLKQATDPVVDKLEQDAGLHKLTASPEAAAAAKDTAPHGVGPSRGTIEVSPQAKSTKVFQDNISKTQGGREFVFDPESGKALSAPEACRQHWQSQL
jgi:hypothetical protein